MAQGNKSNARFTALQKFGVLALSLVLAVGQIPFAWAADTAFTANDAAVTSDDDHSQDLTAEEYAQLGLTLDESVAKEAVAPYSTTNTTNFLVNSEVYMAANGAKGNQYVIRNGLDELRGKGAFSTKLENDTGWIYGSAGLWSSLNDLDSDNIEDKGEYGGGTTSYLSTNSVVVSSGDEGYSGIYATSVEFRKGVLAGEADTGTDTKKSCIAELRAAGDKNTTTLADGTKYTGGISIELMKVDTNGNRSHMATLYPTIVAAQTNGSAFQYLYTGYVQTLDSYFEVESGDIDGDGADEIFAYAGAFEDEGGDDPTRYAIVNMFKRTHNADDGTDTWASSEVKIAAGKASEYSTEERCSGGHSDFALQASPVVTLATGDFDRNGADELAITVSAPYGKTNVSSARCELFAWSSADGAGTLKHVDGFPSDGDGSISLASTNGDGKAMVAASCTFGSFTYYNAMGLATSKTVEGLIIAGYESLDSRYWYDEDSYFTKAAFRLAYYDIDSGKYVVSDYDTFNLSDDGQLIVTRSADHSEEGGRFACTLAPIALCTANLNGINENGATNDAVLLAGDIYNNFVCFTDVLDGGVGGFNMATGHMSIYSDDRYNASNSHDKKNTEQIWISNVVSGTVDISNVCTDPNNYNGNFNETFLATIGTHRDEDLGKDDDYYWMDVSHYTLAYNSADGTFSEKTGQEQVICESNRKNSTYGTWISICLPDIDNDGIVMTPHKVDDEGNTSYLTYTNPTILAVLQDSPYYQDLEDVYGYVTSAAGTSFAKSASTGSTSGGLSLEGEFGGAVDVEGGFLAVGEIEVELLAQGSYEYEEERIVKYSAEYDAHAGEGDKVVVYTLPMVYYAYDLTMESTGQTAFVTLPVSLGMETAVVSTEEYDEIAEAHGLIQAGDFVSSSSGHPMSYESETDRFGQDSDDVNRVYTATDWQQTTSSTGATVTSAIEVEDTDKTSYEIGGTVNAKVVGGGKFLAEKAMFGVAGGFSAGYTHMSLTSTGAEFAGMVDNLPEAAGSDYLFQWRVGVNAYSKDDTSFWLIGYDVQNTRAPASPAITGFSVESATSDSVTLTWDDSLSGYEETGLRYGIGMLGINTDEVTAWKVADIGTTSLVWDGLESKTSYRFVIAAIDESGLYSGIPSAVLGAATLPEGMTLAIEGISDYPSTKSSLYALYEPVGSTITLYARGTIGSKDISADTLNYTWFKKAAGESKWTTVKRGTAKSGEAATYEFEMTPEDNGAQYYCMASMTQYSINTDVVRIYAQSETESAYDSGLARKLHQAMRRLSSTQAKTFVESDAAEATNMVYMLADVNNSGRINIVDAQIVSDLANAEYGTDYASYPLPEEWDVDRLKLVADVNTDAAVDAVDAFAIQRYVHTGDFAE